MSEWFKKNIRGLGKSYMNSDSSVTAPAPEDTGLLDRLGDAASDVGDWIGSHMVSVENNPMYDDYTKLADHVLTDDRSLAADNNTTLGAFTNAAVHGAAGTGAGLARMFHADTLADRLNAVAKNVEDTEAIDPSFSLEYILNPHGLARSTGEVAGSVASIAPTAMFVPEGVVGAGTGLVGRMGANRALQWLIDRGYYTAANRIASTIPGNIQYGLGSALTEALAEGGGSREEALNAGLSEAEATKRSIETAALNLPLLMGSNTIEAGLLRGLGNIPARAGAGAIERYATAPFRAVPGAIANGLQQGAEEFYQEGIQAGVSGREYGLTPFTGSDEQYKAAAEGFAGSLLPGLAGGTVSGLGRRRREERSDRSIGEMQERLAELAEARRNAEQNGSGTEDGISKVIASIRDNVRRIQAEIDNLGNGQAPSANASGQGTREDTSGNQGLRQFIISDEVSNPTLDELTNRKALLLNNDYYNKYGRDLFVTSMKRNGNPDGSSSYHDSGQAFDTADDLLESDAEARNWLIEQGKKYGLYALDEYEHPSANATGGHVHFSDHGEEISGSDDRGTSESSRNADDFSDLHTKNPDPARIWDFLRASGYSEEATAGIMGRMKQERGDFSATMEPFQMLDGIGEVGGMGMFQWTYDRGEGDTPNPDSRLAYYLQWCEENNLEPEDALNQLTYMRDVDLKDQRTTLYTGHTFDPDEMNALDRHGAADLWTRHYERGQAGNEHDYADEIFNQYSGRKVGAPSPGVSRNTGKTTNAAGTSTTQRQEPIEIPDESSKLYEDFAREQMKDSQSYNWADFVDFFKGGKPDGEFLGTEENLAKIKELAEGIHAKEFDEFMKRNATQEEAPEAKPPKAKTAPETPKIETKADRLASLREKLEEKKEEARKAQDFATVSKINKALMTENTDSMISLAGVPKNYLESPAPVETTTQAQTEQIAQNTQNQAQVESAQNQGKVESVQNPVNDMEARDRDIQRKAYEYGMAPVAEAKAEREKQGKGLIITAAASELSLPDKLKRGLRNGSADAIREAQEIVRKEIPAPAFDGAVPISRSAIEATDRAGGTANENPESTKATTEESTGNAENQNQDTESGQGAKAQQVVAGTNPYQGTESGQTQEAKDSAGEAKTSGQEEEPMRATADSKVEPTSNEGGEKSAQQEEPSIDDDYHGFLDGKKPGAVKEIRKQLEKKDNPFGNAKGFMTTKHVVERLAESDDENQSEKKGDAFYLHGNKVSKAVYGYYNHLFQQKPGKSNQGESVPQAEFTEHSRYNEYRAKYKNGSTTITGKNGSVSLDWQDLENILEAEEGDRLKGNWSAEANKKHKERVQGNITTLVDRLGDDSKALDYYGNPANVNSLMNLLREVHRGAKYRSDSEKRLKENTPKIIAKMQKLIDDEDIGGIRSALWLNDNKVSIKAFSDITGVALSPRQKERMQQIKEYFGDKYTKWEEQKAKAAEEEERKKAAEAERERQERTEKAEKDWKDGKAISGDDFLLLCDKYGVDVSISTKGVLKNKIRSIKNDGTIYGAKFKKYPQGVYRVWRQLNDAMEESSGAPDESVDSLFKRGGTKTAVQSKEKPDISRAKEEMQAVAKKYANGEIAQVKAYSKIAEIAKDVATVPKDGLPNVTLIDRDIKKELNDYGDRLIDEATTAKQETPSEQKGDAIRNTNAHLMNDKGAENTDAVKAYKEKAEKIIADVKSKKITASTAKSKLLELMGDANTDYSSGKMTNDEKLAAQGFLGGAFEVLNNRLARARGKKTGNEKAEPKQEKPAEEEASAPKSQFGDKDQNIDNMLEALGIAEGEEEELSFTNEFGDTTDEEIEALKKELQKELSKLSVNPVFNPKIYTLGLQLGGKYIQKGYRTFKKWTEKMTGDLGEGIEPWAPAIWETLKTYPKGQKLDPKQVMAISRVIGNHFEEGITTLKGNQEAMQKILKGRYKEFAPMIEASYNGIEKYFSTIKEGENNADDSTRELASRTGKGNNQDAVGADDESGRPRSGSVGEGVQEASDDIQRQGGSGVRDSSASSGRASGHRGVQAEESEDRADSAGSAELSGSVRAGYEGSLALDDGRQAEDIVSSEERRDHAGDREEGQVKKKVPYKAGSLDSIKHDLPMLLPEQQEDVEFIEKRLLVNNGTGVLLTNGTGTGKTYSGLGMVKRFYDSGKKNILIVVPSEEVAKQWSESAGKDFGIDVKPLAGVTDNGESGVCVTTYANFQQNKELATREWDAVVADEAHNLMQNEQGKPTGYLDMLRVLTLHPKEFYRRWQLQNRTKKIRSLEEKIDDAKRSMQKADRALKDGKIDSAEFARRNKKAEEAIKQNETLIYDEYQKMNDKWKEVKKELEAMDTKDRPKVLFLSATPFAYDKDVDYAEGYLFDYDKAEGGRYNQATGRDKFMVENFGYRMRYNKLTKPETQVDNRVMEVQFHDRLVNSGAMRGRMIDIDVDYDRGFLLVDGGIGTKIDEGFRFLRDSKKYNDLYEALNKQFDRRAKRYLLESIKAKAAIPIVREYIQSGKKVVLFHQAMQDKMNVHPFQLKGATGRTQEETDKVRAQWAAFQQERPDLVQLKLSDIPSPMETFKAAFGEDALYIDGSAEHKKGRDSAQKLFNDDDSGKNLIICQQDAANAGISLHDTTGKHQRVLINIAMPERPIYAMQIEGRIYRIGSKTNAVFRYLATGTDMEKTIFADTIGGRAETAENLAQGQDARGLHDSFTNLYMETMDGSWERRKPGHKEEGTGGKDMDFSGKEDVSDWQRAKAFYYGQQKKTGKTKAQEGKDYFATPEPVGLKMVQWLGLKDGDSVLEPSAGHGAISRWFSPNTSNTIVEPSGNLSPIAQMVTPNAKAVNSTFEDFNIVNKFDGVVMNPPFGSGGKTAVDHIAKAYRHLKDGGRMVAILPEGPAADAQFNKWFYGENKKGEQVQEPPKGAMLAAQIHLPSVTFGRAGTGVATRIVVIDKQMDKAQADKAYASFGYGRETDLRDIKDINELFDRMENMTVPERVKTSEDDSKGESSTEYSLRDSYQADVDGNKVTVRSDGSITGDTYTARKTIKKYGAKWDKDNKAWVIQDKDELVRFINNYNTDGVTIEKPSSQKPIEDMRVKTIIDYLEGVSREDIANIPEERKNVIRQAANGTAFRAVETDVGGIMLMGTKGTERTLAAFDALTPAETAYYALEGGNNLWGKSLADDIRSALMERLGEGVKQIPSSNRKYSLDGKPIVGVRKYSAAWHGSPHKFDTFSLQSIGTGEGAQVHGWGLYFAKERKVSEDYRDALSEETSVITYKLDRYIGPGTWRKEEDGSYVRGAEYFLFAAIEEAKGDKESAKKILKRRMRNEAATTHAHLLEKAYEILSNDPHLTWKGANNGSLFQVEIPDEDVMLDEQKPFREQPEKVQTALRKLISESPTAQKRASFAEQIYEATGRKIYGIVSGLAEGDAPKGADIDNIYKLGSELLNKYGIKGISYEGGRDGRCYVVFDDKAIEIIQRLSMQEGNAGSRSVSELKEEAKAAFPNAKVEDKGDTLVMTMPNGQKVTVALHESIEVSDEELSMAKSSHGFDKGASVTIEGYAETVNGDGFIALSQGSRKGTGFHEAYHIAEAMAFTKKELADAKRLISDNEEKRADAYAKWKLSRQKHSNFAKLWQKIADVAAKMAGILGYETKRNVFRKVASGEVYERDNTGAKDAEKKFSLDNSDNSRESVTQKIKNLVGYVKGEKGKQMFRRKMTDMLSEACGVKIRYGHKSTANGVTVSYDERKKTIRSAHAYDWENILPVASDLIAERLGVQKSDAMRNYITNWILEGAPNNTSKEADEFHEAMQRNPHYGDRLLNLRFTFQEWADKSAEDRMDASVQWAKPSDVSWKDRKNDLYDQFIESLGPVERLVKEAKKNGVEIADAVNPAVAFRLFRGNYGRAITMIEGRGEAALHGLQMNFPGVDFTGFKTLHDILKGIDALQNVDKQKDFVRYCMCKHILDMHKRNKDLERYIDALDVRKDEIAGEIEELKAEKANLKKKLSLYQSEVKRMEQIDKAIKKNRDELAQCDKEIKQWQEKHMAIPDAYSEEECKKVIEKWKGEFDEAQKQIVTFSDVTAQILYKGGVISYNRLKNMRKTWPNYVPLFRVFEENDEIDFGDSLKTMEGSARDVVNPLESIVKNTVEFVKRAEKNKAKVLLADLAMCEGTGSLLDIVDDAKPNDKTTIIYYENGKKKYLQTDPSVVEAINAMDRRNSNAVLKFIHAITSFGRSMFTMFSPEFALRNVLRDYADAFVYGKNGIIGIGDWVRGMMHAIHRDATYYEWLSSGAAIASAVSLDRDYTQEMIDKLGRSMLTRAKSGPKGALFAALESLQKIGEYSEYATRISRYEKTKKQLIKEKRMEAREALISAAFESRDLMDFSRSGEAGAFWNKLVPFVNASLQGMDKFYREVLDPEGWMTNPKQMLRTTARMILVGVLPSLLLGMLYGDDDWYKEEPAWLKETHWTLKLTENVLLRIPKGNDVGVRFFSNLVDKALDKEPHKLKEYAMPFWNMLPDLLPIVFKPLIEANLNKSFFTGKAIVPTHQEKSLPEKLQYGPYTTGFSKFLGEKLDIAPNKIDHVIAGYGGSLGMLPFRLVDILAGDRQLDTSITEMPLTRALTYMPYKNPRSVTRYYDELDKQKKLQNEYKMTHEKPDDFDPAYLKRLESIDKEMKKLSKRERDAINNKSYDIDQRKSIQNDIQKRRISLVNRVLK